MFMDSVCGQGVCFLTSPRVEKWERIIWSSLKENLQKNKIVLWFLNIAASLLRYPKALIQLSYKFNGWQPCPQQEVGTRRSLRFPSNPHHSMIWVLLIQTCCVYLEGLYPVLDLLPQLQGNQSFPGRSRKQRQTLLPLFIISGPSTLKQSWHSYFRVTPSINCSISVWQCPCQWLIILPRNAFCEWSVCPTTSVHSFYYTRAYVVKEPQAQTPNHPQQVLINDQVISNKCKVFQIYPDRFSVKPF